MVVTACSGRLSDELWGEPGEVVEQRDRVLLAAIQEGLPLVSHPYRVVGERIGMSEQEVLTRIARLTDGGVIKRFGVVVRHHELGFRANAMVVWDVPDEEADALGQRLAQHPSVRLCYRRRRRLPEWPYNLYCMIHGRDRSRVLETITRLIEQFGLVGFRHDVLFSTRRFKQRGAIYACADGGGLDG